MNYKKMSYQELKKEVFLLEHGFYDEDVVEYYKDKKRLASLLGNTVHMVYLRDGVMNFSFNNNITMTYNPTEEWISMLRKEFFKNKYRVKQ